MTIKCSADFNVITFEARARIGGAINRSVTFSDIGSFTVWQDEEPIDVGDYAVSAKFVETGLRESVIRFRTVRGRTEIQLFGLLSDDQMDRVFGLAFQIIENPSRRGFMDFYHGGEAYEEKEDGPIEIKLEYAKLYVRNEKGEVGTEVYVTL